MVEGNTMPSKLPTSGLFLLPSGVTRYLLPASCALCGADCLDLVCAPCLADFFHHDGPRCRQCANPLSVDMNVDMNVDLTEAPDGLRCGRCQRCAPAFDATLVAGDYAAPLSQLVLQLKFGGRLALATLFAQRLHEAMLRQSHCELPALLCPVPLGPARLAERGFNQALEIARPLAQMLGLPLHPTLTLRIRETRAQTGVAHGERASNIAQAFTVAPAALALVRGSHVGIVDDVMSSGQTLDELAATLKRFGAARVTNLVFARTRPN
jgi:ComF family protein